MSEEKKDEYACMNSLNQFTLKMKVRVKFSVDQLVSQAHQYLYIA